MTYGDVMVQILSEVTGKPKDQVGELLNIFKDSFPGQHRLDEDLPPEKADQLLNDLRKEKAGILAWLEKGAQEVNKRQGHA